jgi:transposase
MPVRHPFPAGAAEQLAPLLPEIKTKAVYQRFPGVWLRATLPLSAPQMAPALGWKPPSVRPLHSDYARDGEVVLWGKPHSGRRPAHFTAEEEKAWLAPFLEQAQARGLLVIAPVPAAYAKALGRPVHPSVVYRALQRPGWGKIMPRPKHPKASEEVRESFQKVTRARAGANSGTGRFPRPDFTGPPDVGGRGPLRAPQRPTPVLGAGREAPGSGGAEGA